MNNLSLTQKFLLCALKSQGNARLSTETSCCLFTGALLELMIDGYIYINDQMKVIIENDLSPEKMYLAPVYNLIKAGKPMNIEKISEKYAFDLKKSNELLWSVAKSLEDEGYLTVEHTKGFLSTKTLFIPDEREVRKIVEKLRTELLEAGQISDEIMALGALLNGAKITKKFFSKYELQMLNERLKEMKTSEAGIMVKIIMDHIIALQILLFNF